MIHRGEIVEKVVRKGGYSLARLATKLDICRNTLYNRFKLGDLSYSFISQVGKVIHYDFAFDFPELKQPTGPLNEDPISTHIGRLESEYSKLLEKYNKLLEILIRVVSKNDLPTLQQEIDQIIEKELKI